MRRRILGLLVVPALFAVIALGGCQSSAGGAGASTQTASATVQRTAITICTAYADALQVAAVLRRARQLSDAAVASIDSVRVRMTPACTSPVTEAGLQSLTDGLAAIVAAMKGGT